MPQYKALRPKGEVMWPCEITAGKT